MLDVVPVSRFLENPDQYVIIDVRSESEFRDAQIPGAFNVPILDDAQRVEVGTLYKQRGSDIARKRGLELVAPKLPTMVETILGLWRKYGAAKDGETSNGKRLLVHCWRGGERSKSVATILSLMKVMPVSVLEGGHKAFRNFTLEFLNARYPFKLCTLWGLTGCAKTAILLDWKAAGRPVIDLEGLAHHRGSAFGQVGIDKFGEQKEFETNLFWEMWKLRHEPVVIVEGESRRIGRCMLPEIFMTQMQEGIQVKVDRTIDERVAHILNVYVNPVERERMVSEARRSLDAIKKRLGSEKFISLSKLLDEGNYAEFTKILLLDYYDKMYQNSRADESFYALTIRDAADWPRLERMLIAQTQSSAPLLITAVDRTTVTSATAIS